MPYERRQDFLLDADVGVSTHLLHLETAYSFRTRMLDYLWAGLPVVTTTGDGFAELVAEHGIGRTVPPADVDALAGALEELLGDDDEEGLRRGEPGAGPALRVARRARAARRLLPAAAAVGRRPVPPVATASHTAPPGRSGMVRDFRTAARVVPGAGRYGLAEVSGGMSPASARCERDGVTNGAGEAPFPRTTTQAPSTDERLGRIGNSIRTKVVSPARTTSFAAANGLADESPISRALMWTGSSQIR